VLNARMNGKEVRRVGKERKHKKIETK